MRSYAFSSLGNSVRVRLDVLIAASVDANLFQTGTEDAGAQVLSVLQSPTGTAEDKLRLLCTYYWHCDSIDSGKLDECIAAVKRAGGNDAALNFLVRHLLYALSFHVAFLLTPLERELEGQRFEFAAAGNEESLQGEIQQRRYCGSVCNQRFLAYWVIPAST